MQYWHLSHQDRAITGRAIAEVNALCSSPRTILPLHYQSHIGVPDALS